MPRSERGHQVTGSFVCLKPFHLCKEDDADTGQGKREGSEGATGVVRDGRRERT